jgi:8-oxo-dGTP diphosphatase
MATGTESERVDVAYSLIVDPETNKILVVGYRNGGWSLPGGAREPGETLGETVVRETKEEAGVLVAVDQLLGVNERFPDPHALFFMFSARIVDGTPRVTDDEEMDRIKWVDAQEANKLLHYWPIDFTRHSEYRAFYQAAKWPDHD